ncbi:MAG TPA: glycosyltransferase family 2 protein [Solirubrobacteraceae bacterium]|nr:glycosyltransferase family 2 protein [Solirubrobacteraceae bacterium]
MSARPRVSVILASYNAWEHLERCLRSLLEHTTSADLEIVVVDNASADGTPERLPVAFPSARLIANDHNAGFARANNQGMAAATGDLLLLLNSDTYVEDDVIGRAAAHLLARPGIGMLGVDLRFPHGRRQHVANRRLSVRRSLVERLWLYKLIPRARRGSYLLGGYWEEDREIEVDWLAGAFMLLRPALFARSGGFDEQFWMYGEDSEWCMRLRRSGVRILYAPRIGIVYHVGAASSDLLWTERERLARCHRGGLDAYAAVHGQARGRIYHAAELAGAAVRWAVHATAVRARGSEYHAAQADFYGWLARLFAAEVVRRARR